MIEILLWLVLGVSAIEVGAASRVVVVPGDPEVDVGP